jgi:histidinol-phosphate aminotransferase
MKANNYLENIAIYKPGKDKVGKRNAVKLSANENPLGCSEHISKFYKDHFKDLSIYCDPSCEKLRTKIAQINNINSDQIICSAGSDEAISMLIYSFCKEGDEILYSKHGFLMYPISAAKIGAKSIKVNEINFKTDIDDLLKKISKKTRIIFLANPNNPTGSYLTNEEINKIISLVPKNILIVFDHAYHEYCRSDDYPQNILDIAKKHDNIAVTRTFSKIYGLASLRIGWCFSSNYVIDILNKIRGPFNVSGPAQIGALAALDDQEFINRSVNHNNKWLKIYKTELKDNKNFKAYDSVANFILIDFFKNEICDKYNQELLNNAIIARKVCAYGLESCLRITIGKDRDNESVIDVLNNVKNV